MSLSLPHPSLSSHFVGLVKEPGREAELQAHLVDRQPCSLHQLGSLTVATVAQINLQGAARRTPRQDSLLSHQTHSDKKGNKSHRDVERLC